MINKHIISFSLAMGFSAFMLISCGGGAETGKKDMETEETPAVVEETPVLDLSAGEAIYMGKGICFSCHQPDGKGMSPNFPPLANADYLLADKQRAIHQAIFGSKEPITVNGTTYPGGIMTVAPLTDQEVVDVVNYILNSWGNNAGIVTLEEVQNVRAAASN